MSKNNLYFAYGSNLNQQDLEEWRKENPEYADVDLKFNKVTNAYLPAFRLGFTRKSKMARRQYMGVADVVPSDDPLSRVWGAIYELTEEQLEKIDHYEGYRKDRDPKKNFYNRLQVEVVDKRGVKQACLTYQAEVGDEKKRKCLYHRPCEQYCEVMRKGGEDHGLAKEFFEHLKVASVTERNP